MKNKLKITIIVVSILTIITGIILNVLYNNYLNKEEAICKSKLSRIARGYECNISEDNFKNGTYKTFPERFKFQLNIK